MSDYESVFNRVTDAVRNFRIEVNDDLPNKWTNHNGLLPEEELQKEFLEPWNNGTMKSVLGEMTSCMDIISDSVMGDHCRGKGWQIIAGYKTAMKKKKAYGCQMQLKAFIDYLQRICRVIYTVKEG